MNGPALRRAAAVATALLVVIGAADTDRVTAVAGVATVAGLLSALLIGIDRGPVLVAVPIGGVAVSVLCSGSSTHLGWFGLCVLVGWSVFREGLRPGVVAAATAAIVVLLVEWVVTFDHDPGWLAWVAGTALTGAMSWIARRQGDLIEQLHVAQASLAETARVEERNHIARELHDVIGHSLTASLIHVASARLAVEEDPTEAGAALAEAERLCRESLAEVRQAVGLLRTPDVAPAAPMPGVDQLPALVDSFRATGASISFRAEGDLSHLGATAGLTVYRILQEALTNVVRHSPERAARVSIETTRDRTVLTVSSTGGPGIDDGTGVGLDGMRERAAAVGGELIVGATDDGWRVRAVLPAKGATR